MLSLDQLKGKTTLNREETLDLLENSIILLTSWGVSTYLINRVKIIKERFKGRRLQGKVAKEYLFIMKLGIIASGASSSVIASISRLADNFMGEISGQIIIELIATLIDSSGEVITPPSNLVATAISDTEIDLTWDDNSSNETGFEIYRATSVDGTYTLIETTAANVESYSDTGLTENTTYYYKIRAKKNTSFSTYTSTASATTEEETPDYDSLATYFTGGKWVQFRRDKMFKDTGRSIAATNLDTVTNTTEQINNNHLVWQGPYVRKDRPNYFDTYWGANHERNRPLAVMLPGFHDGLYQPNVAQMAMESAAFTAMTANERSWFIVFMELRGVPDENYSQHLKNEAYNHYSTDLGNGRTQFDAGFGNFEELKVVEITYNKTGLLATLRINNVQVGTTESFTDNNITQLMLGTLSHAGESIIYATGWINGAISAPTRTALYAQLDAVYGIGSKPSPAHPTNIQVAFDGVDNFTFTNTGAYTDIQWGMYNGSSVFKGTAIEAARPILGAIGTSLSRSLYRQYFDTFGNQNSEVFVMLKGAYGFYNRSRLLKDEVAGTPLSNLPPILSSAVIADAAKDKVVLNFTGGGTINSGTGSINDFRVWINDIEDTIGNYALTYTGARQLTLTKNTNFTGGDNVMVRHTRSNLADSNAVAIVDFMTGIHVAIVNNIASLKEIKINFSQGGTHNGDSTWNNINETYDSAYTPLVANLNDSGGIARSISVSLPVRTAGWGTSAVVPSISAPYNATIAKKNIIANSYGIYNTGTLVFAGFTPGETIQFSILTLSDDGASDGNIVIDHGGADVSFLNVDGNVAVINTATLTADGSGNISVTFSTTTSNRVFGVCGIILGILR